MSGDVKPNVPISADELRKARKTRNRAVLGFIFGLAVLFYVITIVRMSV